MDFDYLPYKCANCGWTGDHEAVVYGYPEDVNDHYEPSDLADGGGVESCPDCNHAVFLPSSE